MPLSEEETNEVYKLKKLDKQFETIIRTSRNAAQLKRAKIDLKKIRDRLDELCPDGVPVDLTTETSSGLSEAEKYDSYNVLSKFSIQKVSPNSDDRDINLMGTVLYAWEHEFAMGLGDNHLKLDFSLSSERDSHFAILENNKRYLKNLTETIEDYSKANRDDFKTQLRDMKQKYSRHFLSESYAFLKRLKDFWKKIQDDIERDGHGCMNPDEAIKFDRSLENATFLEGEPVPNAVKLAVVFLSEAIDALHLPEIKKEKG